MNWSVPPLINTPLPAPPRWLRWGIALLLMLVAGFFLTIYLLSPDELRDKNHIVLMALGIPFIGWCLILGIRLIGYDLQTARINARNQVITHRRSQWKRWANQKINLLAWSRQTALGVQDYALMVGKQPAINQGNRLTMAEFSDMASWESRTQLIARLLQPVSEVWASYSPTQPLTLLWQVPPGAVKEADWAQILEQEAQRQSLPFTTIAPLTQRNYAEWLLAAYEQPLQGLFCLLFIDLSDTSPASEEAVSLLVATDALCQQAQLTPKAQLLRPLLTPVSTLSQAMTQQGKQQCPPAKIVAGWQGTLSVPLAEKIPVSCAELKINFQAHQLYDVDSALGLPS